MAPILYTYPICIRKWCINRHEKERENQNKNDRPDKVSFVQKKLWYFPIFVYICHRILAKLVCKDDKILMKYIIFTTKNEYFVTKAGF